MWLWTILTILRVIVIDVGVGVGVGGHPDGAPASACQSLKPGTSPEKASTALAATPVLFSQYLKYSIICT